MFEGGFTVEDAEEVCAGAGSSAAAQLDAAQYDEAVACHAARYTELSEQAALELTGPQPVPWLNRLHAEQGNLLRVRSAGGEHAARVVASIRWFWLQFGHGQEGDRWLTAVLDDRAVTGPALLLRLREGAAWLAAPPVTRLVPGTTSRSARRWRPIWPTVPRGCA